LNLIGLTLLVWSCGYTPQSLLIRNVTIIPMTTEDFSFTGSVYLEEGKISAVWDASAVEVPEGATVVDGTGQFLVPGYGDMNTMDQLASSEFNAVEFPLENNAKLYLANGVTLVRVIWGDPGAPQASGNERQGLCAGTGAPPHITLCEQ
jgi:adenine deaminase